MIAPEHDSAADTDLGPWLARELHDSALQELTSMLVDLEDFRRSQVGRSGVLSQVDRTQEGVRTVIFNIRQLLFQLRDQPLTEPAFPQLVAAQLAEFEARTGIQTRLHVTGGWPLQIPSTIATNLYRIIQEALANVRAHSGATLVEVSLRRSFADIVGVSVRDDGHGREDLAQLLRAGMGIRGMHERAGVLGGNLCIESAPSRGTTVTVSVPIRDVT